MKGACILGAVLLFQQVSEAIIHIPKFADGTAVVLESGAGPWGWGESFTIDKSGKRIDPVKEEASQQSAGTEADRGGPHYESIHVNHRHGLKNRATGEVVIKPTWHDLRHSGKHCIVADDTDRYGVIDLEGNVVVELEWEDVRELGPGRWMVERGGKYGLVAPDGLLAEAEWEQVGNLWRRFAKNGLLEVRKDGKWGFVDESGKLRIGYKFDTAGHFGFMDRTIVSTDGDYYLIDQTGELLTKLPGAAWDELNGSVVDIGPGPYIRLAKDGKWGCSDLSGKLVIPFEYEQISSPSHDGIFSEGVAPVVRDGKWGFVDQEGKLVIPCKWDLAGEFSEGLAYVERKGHWGFIGKTGETRIGPVKIKPREEGE